MSHRPAIQRLVSAVIGLCVLFAIGEFPAGVLALELVDDEHEVVVAIEHTVLHVRIAHERSEEPVNANHSRALDAGDARRAPHDAHGVHMPRFDHQRQIVAALPDAPPLAPDFCDDLHFAAVATSASEPVASIAPGEEHAAPPDLQRTVILLI